MPFYDVVSVMSIAQIALCMNHAILWGIIFRMVFQVAQIQLEST